MTANLKVGISGLVPPAPHSLVKGSEITGMSAVMIHLVKVQWLILVVSFEGTQWVCAAFTATHIENTFWLQAGKCLMFSCWHCVEMVWLWLFSGVLTLSLMCWHSDFYLLQLRWADFAVGRQEHATATERDSRGRWSVEAEVASNPWAPAASSLHAQWLPYPSLPAGLRWVWRTDGATVKS